MCDLTMPLELPNGSVLKSLLANTHSQNQNKMTKTQFVP